MRVAKGKRKEQPLLEHERKVAKKFWKDSFKNSQINHAEAF